jgi:hypothetical protein
MPIDWRAAVEKYCLSSAPFPAGGAGIAEANRQFAALSLQVYLQV